MNRIRSVTALVLASTFFVPLFVDAAALYMDPDGGEVSPDQLFSVDIRVNNQDECLNAFDVELLYPQEEIEATVVSRGRSILTLWVEEPLIQHSEGKVSFVGGVPGGYCGRIPGDPDLTNILATVVFQPENERIQAEEVALEFGPDSSVLLSDGRGTEASLETSGAVYSVGDNPTVDASDWLTVAREDERPPESFTIELGQDDSVFGGEYYITFSTTDKGSGLSHFEVKEEDIDREGYVRRSDQEARFRQARSPYVLNDQSLNSVITVRAVDNAGNERVERFVPDESQRYDDSTWADGIFAGSLELGVVASLLAGALFFVLLAYFYHRRQKKIALETQSVHNDDHERENM